MSTLSCSSCNSDLTNLDFSNNENLNSVSLFNATIGSINLTNCTNLITLSLGNTRNIESINLSDCINLEFLRLDRGMGGEIDLSNNTKLRVFYSFSTGFKNIDLSNNISLTEIYLTNTSTRSLNLANGNNQSITNFDTTGSSYLSCIKVDDVNFSIENFTNIDSHTSFTNALCDTYYELSGLTVSNNFSFSGVTIEPESPDNYYADGTEVTIIAKPSFDEQFNGWSEDASGNDDPLLVTMDRNKNIVANFSPKEYNVFIVKNIDNGGTITVSPDSTDGTYEYGTTITITASP